MTDIVEQAARVACPNGPDHDHQPNLDQGCNWALQLCQTLADAGLLREPARTVPTREQIARALSTHHYSIAYGGCACGADFEDETETLEAEQEAYNQHAADEVLELLAGQPTVAEVKAEALEEAAAALREIPDSDPANLWMNNDSADWLQARAQQARQQNR